MEHLEKLDIVLTIFNQEKLIKKILYGVFKNTTTPFNLILIFDGCTDASETVALTYIKAFKPTFLAKLIIKRSSNVFETKANNLGFKLTKENYLITLQDDMYIQELGWEKRLTFPLRTIKDTLAVTSRIAQDIDHMDANRELYINRMGRELNTLDRTTFAIRDVINRGPVAIRTSFLKKLNYLNENFAPSVLDDADLSLRAWTKYKWRVGVFSIDYSSPLVWGKTRAKDSAMNLGAANKKNRTLIGQKYQKYILSKRKHDANLTIKEEAIDYSPVKESWYKSLVYFPFDVELHFFLKKVKAYPPIALNSFIVFCKRLVTVPLFGLLKLIGLGSIQENGLWNYLSTNVGKTNGPEREKWLEKTLKKIPTGKTILDAGAGELQYKRFCSHLTYTSQDFGQYDGQGNSNGFQMGTWDNSKLDIVSDITSIPVKDKSFDAVMCIEVFEHIPDPISALKEFSRLLKPGGKLIITAPFCSLTHFAPYFYQNGLSRYWYEKFLTDFGFKIDELVLNGNYFDYLAQEMRRLPDVLHNYVPKKRRPSMFFKLLQVLILRELKTMSNVGQASSEVLCFGIHVLATKK